MADEVDVRRETMEHLESQIEQSLGLTQPVGVGNPSDADSESDGDTFDLADARLKITQWSGGLISVAFSAFKNKLKINKEQCDSLGLAWGGVVGKWYPLSWLEKTQEAGDSVSGFNSEMVAIKETWLIFGDRVIKKEKNPKIGETKKKQNTPPTPPGFPPTIGINL